MATSNSRSVSQLFGEYGYRSALRTKMIGQHIDAQDLETPSGKENFIFEVGQKVEASGEGTIKAGTKLEVKDRQMNNGFCQYYAAGVWHLQQDLVA